MLNQVKQLPSFKAADAEPEEEVSLALAETEMDQGQECQFLSLLSPFPSRRAV